jgi:hypothetical protein
MIKKVIDARGRNIKNTCEILAGKYKIARDLKNIYANEWRALLNSLISGSFLDTSMLSHETERPISKYLWREC